MKAVILTIAILLLTITFFGCKKKAPVKLSPTVSTHGVSGIKKNEVYIEYSVTELSPYSCDIVPERGVVVGLKTNPELNVNSKIVPNGCSLGGGLVLVDGLSANTMYYARAYAKYNVNSNNYGIIYSQELTFTTLP